MITYFKEKQLIAYPNRIPRSWEEAIHISCQTLLEQQYITPKYIEEVTKSIKEHGPYIVIMPNIAIPHAAGNSESVKKSGISLTRFKESVFFYDEKEQEEKSAILFFTLAAKNEEEHLENMMKLTDLLSNDGLLEALITTTSFEDLEQLLTINPD